MMEFVEQFDGFKKTEVGLFPKNWRVVKISEVGEIIRGASPRPKVLRWKYSKTNG
jgi:restriction endonuclease S subunit